MADSVIGNLQDRFESSALGRAAISGVLLFVLAVFLASNLPDSKIKRELSRIVQPARDSTGLDQYWGVFAPDPRMETWGIKANVTYSDGSTGTWTTPNGDALVGAYRIYRWNKYAEQVFQSDRSVLWPHLTLWLIRKLDLPQRHPVRIELIRRWYALNPPGSKVTRGPWQEKTFYIQVVTPQLLRRVMGER